MNKIVVLFIALFLIFCVSWVVKSKTPLNKKTDIAHDVSNWWDNKGEIENLNHEVSDEWILDPEIPENYVPVIGGDELYMVVNDNGTIEKYRQRTKNEKGEWIWKDVNPDIPDNYEAVDGLDNVYKVTDAEGNVHYYKYVRNDDNSFAFVEVDENGNIIDTYITSCEAQALIDNDIPINYTQIDGNIYGVKNEDGVIVDYKKKTEDADGNLLWSNAKKPVIDDNKHIYTVTNPVVTTKPVVAPEKPPVVTSAPHFDPPKTETTTSQSEQHTQIESYSEVKVEGNYRCTYEYRVVKTYDATGNLLSTKTEGPYLVNKELIMSNPTPEVNPGLIEGNLDNEIVRITNGLNCRTDTANNVINSLNAERMNNNLQLLSTNGDAQKLATLFAADMATYDNTTNTSPLYGSLEDIMNRYGISNQGYALNIWRTTSDDASRIHSRFQTIDGCREARMNGYFNQVGVAVYENNGYYYVAEIIMIQ